MILKVNASFNIFIVLSSLCHCDIYSSRKKEDIRPNLMKPSPLQTEHTSKAKQ